MKSIKRILSRCMAVSLLLGVFSCNDLEEYNPSGAPTDGTWNTPEGFLTLVNAAYSDQRQWYGKEDGVFLSESGTDLWINENLGGYARQVTKYEGLTGADGNPPKAGWRILWSAINLTNAGVNRIDQAGFTSVEERNKRLGELRFLRAFYYWHLVETYGGVMLRTTETVGVNLTAHRSPVEAFYELMIEDLKFAAEHLPANWGTGSNVPYARASKKSALGFLARVYLSRAYYSAGGEANTYFELARNTAKEVIDRKAELGVDLWAKYEDVFKPSNNRNNKEALYVVSNSTNTVLNYDQNGNRLHLWFMPQYSNKPGMQLSMEYGRDNQRRLMPTLALLDFFDEEIDARYKASFREAWISNVSQPFEWTEARVAEFKKDPSLIGTKITPGQDTALFITKKRITNEKMRPYIVIDKDSVYHAATTRGVKDGRNFVHFKKFEDPITRATPEAQPGFLDVIVMRLAEMYLIAAEAEHQLGNNDAAAEYINVLRTRAALPDKVAEMQITAGDVTLDFILDERARELAGEHIRWFDLKRTGKLVERVNRYNPDITLVREHHVLRPIPQTELNALLNGDEFGQNPGY